MTTSGTSRLRLLAGIVVVLGVAALPLLYLASRTVDFERHNANLAQLRRMQALDAVLDQSVIAVRYGLIESYDPIVRALNSLQSALGQLSLEGYRLRADEVQRLSGLREAVQARLLEKSESVESFKIMNSALRNSLGYLPVVAAEVIAEGRAQGLSENDLEIVRHLLEAVLLLSLDMSNAQPADVGARVATLREIRAGIPSDGATRALAEALDSVISHASVVFRSEGMVARLVSSILAKPVRPTLDQLDGALNEAYNRLTAEADFFRRSLAVLALMLVVAAAFAVWRLWAVAKRLDATVRELEFQKWALDQHAIVAMYDEETRLIYANQGFAGMAGRDREQLVGKPFDAVLAPHEPRARIDEIVACIRRGAVWRGVLRCGTGSGGVYFADTTVVPFTSETGHVFRFAFIQSDVSELKRVEAELVAARDQALAATRAKSAFLANMSHELRTPLNAITGYSELLLEEAAGREPALTADLERIRDAGRHLLALVNDVLELSRIEAGRAELEISTFDLNDLLREAAAGLRATVEAHGNVLEVDLQGTALPIRTDPGKLRLVIEQLLSNAGKFTRRGRVTLAGRGLPIGGAGPPRVSISIVDTGAGMTAEAIQRALEPFASGDAATIREQGSTGLGLAIARRLVETLDGTLTVVSEPGRGTEVRLELSGALGPLSAQPALAAQAGGRAAILLVDDDPLIHANVGAQLASEGFEVVSATSGRQALALAKTRPFRAILLDVVMPGMDGWAVLRSLKSDPELAEIPVIMLTIMENAELGLALGAAAYLRKPADPHHLASELRSHARPITGEVLVVDDDPRSREMLQRIFRRQGVPVAEAADGAAALAYLERQPPPGAIILDLAMPGQDGFSVVERLAADDRWRTIPVIVLTAKDLTAREVAALTGHVRRIFQKGRFERSELVAAVREQIGRAVGG